MKAPRRSIVVVDHDDSYTWNLVHLMAEVARVMPLVVHHQRVRVAELADFTHVVLSPGPGAPDNRGDFALGREVFRLPAAILGVCLGMQALVWAHGGTVDVTEPAHGELATVRHHGGHPLVAGVADPFRAVRYHSLAAIDLPDALAEIAWCTEGGQRTTMAVAHRHRPLWGVQFHPESILSEYGAQLIANFWDSAP